jgi:hypothetical protein
MSTSLSDWLAAVPPTDELQNRIDDLERELALLLAAVNVPRPQVERKAPEDSTPPAADGDVDTDAEIPPLSEERKAIVREMLKTPRRMARPRQIGSAMRARGIQVDDRNIATAMQRMFAAKQLIRVAKGLYAVPERTAAEVERELPSAFGNLVVMTS